MEKPDTRVYEHIKQLLADKTERCIFIDDRIENVESAKECGMIGYHLDRKANMTLYDFETFITDVAVNK